MIEVVTGPMKAGKSSYCINRVLTLHRRRIIVLKPLEDTRTPNVFSRTAGGIGVECRLVEGDDGWSEYAHYSDDPDTVVYVDEAMLAGPGIVSLGASYLSRVGRGYLLVSGLRYTSEEKPFGHMELLIAMCSRHVELRALCSVHGCPRPATKTFDTLGKTCAVRIGDEGYQPRCDQHYMEGTLRL